MNKVMICYDGSSRARALVEDTIDLFKDFKPEINLVLIIDTAGTVGHNEDYFWKESEKKLKTCSQWLSEQEYNVETRIFSGHPRQMILEAVADLKPSVTVVGRIDDTHVHFPVPQIDSRSTYKAILLPGAGSIKIELKR